MFLFVAARSNQIAITRAQAQIQIDMDTLSCYDVDEAKALAISGLLPTSMVSQHLVLTHFLSAFSCLSHMRR